jgi:hypothetical protein
MKRGRQDGTELDCTIRCNIHLLGSICCVHTNRMVETDVFEASLCYKSCRTLSRDQPVLPYPISVSADFLLTNKKQRSALGKFLCFVKRRFFTWDCIELSGDEPKFWDIWVVQNTELGRNYCLGILLHVGYFFTTALLECCNTLTWAGQL